MIVINYGTSSNYEENIWDKFFCKTVNSAKRKIKEIMRKEEFNEKDIKKTLEPLDIYIFDKKTCFSCWNIPNLEHLFYNVNYTDLYIGLSEEYLN